MKLLINNGNVEITSIYPAIRLIHLIVHITNITSPGEIEHAVNNNVVLALNYLKDEGFIADKSYMVHAGIIASHSP